MRKIRSPHKFKFHGKLYVDKNNVGHFVGRKIK